MRTRASHPVTRHRSSRAAWGHRFVGAPPASPADLGVVAAGARGSDPGALSSNPGRAADWRREASIIALLLCGEFPELGDRYAVLASPEQERSLVSDVAHVLEAVDAFARGRCGDGELTAACRDLVAGGLPRRTLRRALTFASVVVPATGRLSMPESERRFSAASRVIADSLHPAVAAGEGAR